MEWSHRSCVQFDGEPIDLKRIREKLIQNNLPQQKKALHKVQEERTREAELIEEEEMRRLRDKGQDNQRKRSKSIPTDIIVSRQAKRRSTTKIQKDQRLLDRVFLGS